MGGSARRTATGGLPAFDAKLAVTGFIAFEHAAEGEPQALGGMRAQNNTVGELDLDAAIVRNVPGLVGAEEQVDLLERALDVDDVGEVGGHAAVVPFYRRQQAGVGRGSSRLLGLLGVFR